MTIDPQKQISICIASGEFEIAEMWSRWIGEDIKYRFGKGPRPELNQNSNDEYHFHFNWIGGGYNSVWASSRAEALQRIAQKFGEVHQPDTGSLKVLTQIEEDKFCKLNPFD